MNLKKQSNLTWTVLEKFIQKYKEFMDFFIEAPEEIPENSLKPLTFRSRVDPQGEVKLTFNQDLLPWRNMTEIVETMRLNETDENAHINFMELWIEPGDNNNYWDIELEGSKWRNFKWNMTNCTAKSITL